MSSSEMRNSSLKVFWKKNMHRGSYLFIEAKFLLSMHEYKIPHFSVEWQILKNPSIGRPIVGGYDWILPPAFEGHFLKEFYS